MDVDQDSQGQNGSACDVIQRRLHDSIDLKHPSIKRG